MYGTKALPLLMICAVGLGCSHALKVRNLEMYATPMQLGSAGEKASVAITPFSGNPDSLWYFNAIVERLAMDPSVGELSTDYNPRLATRAGLEPDLIVDIRPTVNYRSSGWNFLINWPGFILFTPGWNGYVYHADVMTQVVIRDSDGNALDQFDVPVSYDLRHADMDRTIWTGLTWLEVSALAFVGGLYNAGTFDRDAIAPMQSQVKDNYSNHVCAQAVKRIRSAAAAVRKPVDVAAPPPEAEEAVEQGLEAPSQ